MKSDPAGCISQPAGPRSSAGCTHDEHFLLVRYPPQVPSTVANANRPQVRIAANTLDGGCQWAPAWA